MNRLMRLLFVCLFLTLKTQAGHSHHHHPEANPEKFLELKKLVGHWEGKSKMSDSGKEKIVKIDYKLASSDTIITENFSMDDNHNMLSVYYVDGKYGVGMTHYCSLGNHPHMKLVKVEGNKFFFKMVGKKDGIKHPKEMHMHALTLTLEDENHLTQEWSHYVKGKEAGIVTIKLEREN